MHYNFGTTLKLIDDHDVNRLAAPIAQVCIAWAAWKADRRPSRLTFHRA
jgi:hypothetical protein